MTVLGALFVAAGVVAAARGRAAYLWVLSASAAFPTSAAIAFGGNAVPPFYLLAIPVLVGLVFSTRHVSGPGRVALQLFVIWSVFITIAGPWLLAGLPVLVPRAGLEAGVAPLTWTISNLAQLVYLLLAVAVVEAAARHRVSPLLPVACFGTGTLLSFANLVVLRLGWPWPGSLFDNAYVTYQTSHFGSVERLRGVFAEPSLLAEFSAAAVPFLLVASGHAGPRGKMVLRLLAGMAFANLVFSQSGTAFVATAALGVLGAVVLAVRAMRGRSATLLVFGGFTLAGVALVWGGSIYGWASSLVGEKIGSQSQVTRSAANLHSLELIGQSFGLGVGLGSNRPSSFAVMLLSCVGVVGFVTFARFLWVLLRGCWRAGQRAIVWGLLGGLAAKVAAVPDLSSPYLWVLIAAAAAVCWGPRVTRRAVAPVPAGRSRTGS